METGKKRKKPEVPSGFVNAGWKKVDVGDDLLLGSEEGGFMELEELVPPTKPSFEVAASRSTEQEDGTGASPTKTSKQKKQRADGKTRLESKQVVKTADAQQTAHVSTPLKEQPAEDVEGLKAKLAALQQENEALKAGQSGQPGKEKHIPADPNSARSRKLSAKRAKAKEVRAAKKATAKARKQRAAERAEQQTGVKVSAKKQAPKKATGDTAAVSVAPVSALAGPAPDKASIAEAPATQAGDMPAWQGLGLGPGVIAAIAGLGFEEPTPIQRECLLPAIRDRRDIIGAAQTGSGKTLAFGLPILQLLHSEALADDAADVGHAEAGCQSQQNRRTPLRALILEPTRELAMQVCEHLQRVAKPLGVWVAPIVGGISPAKQTRLLGRQPQVIVATPGRLWELVRLGEPHLADLSRVCFLVLDEADRMVQQGHFQELSNILESLASQRADVGSRGDDGEAGDNQDDDESNQEDERAGRAQSGADLLQTFVFSATLTLPQKLRKRLRKGGGASGSMMLEDLMESIQFRGKPKVVDLTSQRKLADKVEEATLHCGEEERDELLYYLLAAHPGRTLVFANAVSTARRIAALLHILKLPSAALHAGMQQRARLKALDRFKADENAVLVASDVAARGLDITGVRCVIHYQIPASVDIYVHRSGRTARGSADGLAVALVAPKEAARYAALQQALDRPEPPPFPLNAALLPACRQRVKLAVRLDVILREQSKAHAEKSWKQRTAEAMDMEVSSDDEDEDAPAAKKSRQPQQSNDGSSLAYMQRELDELLAQPLQATFSRRFFTGVPSASVAAQSLPTPAQDAEPAGVDAPAETEQAAAAAEDARISEASKSQMAQQKAVKHTVALAQNAAASRHQAKGVKRGAGASKAALKGPQKLSKKALEQAALAAALQRRQRKRDRGPGLGVAALDRNASGPDALAVMRQARLAVL